MKFDERVEVVVQFLAQSHHLLLFGKARKPSTSKFGSYCKKQFPYWDEDGRHGE